MINYFPTLTLEELCEVVAMSLVVRLGEVVKVSLVVRLSEVVTVLVMLDFGGNSYRN